MTPARRRLPLIGHVWMTTTDAQARALLKDADGFRRDPAAAGAPSFARRLWFLPRGMRPLLRSIIQVDDPEHARLRAAVERAFARTAVEALAPALRARAHALIDAMPPGQVDLVAAYARPLPFGAICDLLGLPAAIQPRLSRAIAPLSGGGAGTVGIALALTRLGPAIRLLRAEAARQARDGGPALIAQLAAEDLTEDERLSLIFTLFVAGHETTVHLIGGALHLALTDPAARAAWDDAPDLRGLWIEEAVRHLSPVAMTKPMTATRDLDFHGAALPRGALVSADLRAANHDPTRVEAPETFRPHRRPNAHLGFGFGPHVCLGMQLARLETRVALEVLLERWPGAHVTAEPRPIARPGMNGPAALMVSRG
ncbi:MAG: cytochrome P450 [Paracoccaceae bacterium]